MEPSVRPMVEYKTVGAPSENKPAHRAGQFAGNGSQDHLECLKRNERSRCKRSPAFNVLAACAPGSGKCPKGVPKWRPDVP